jgi:large subunit ribosomal protein L4
MATDSTLVTEVTTPISVPVVNAQGQNVGTETIDPKDFGGKISKQLLHDVVLMYQANKRAGTHSTLRRGEVAGSTKKLFRQKGTGNARAGTKRTNKRRGGGTAKGPKPRDYSVEIPRKAVRAATRMAILSKFTDGEAVIVDNFGLGETPKTKAMAGALKAINPKGTVLIGTGGVDAVVYKSARNIAGVEVLPAAEFNAYAVLKQKRLVLTRSALDALKASKK